MQKTQPKSLSFTSFRQTGQQISDLFILVEQLWAVTIAGLADPKGASRQSNAGSAPFHHRFGHLSALSWPNYFFPRASFSKSFSMLRSAYIRFSLRFSSSIAFIRPWRHPCRHTSHAICRRMHCSCHARGKARLTAHRLRPGTRSGVRYILSSSSESPQAYCPEILLS